MYINKMNNLPLELWDSIALYSDHRTKLALKCCSMYYDDLICNVSIPRMKRRLVRAVANNNMSMFTYCTGTPHYHTLNQIGFRSDVCGNIEVMQWCRRNGYFVTYKDYIIAATHNQYQMLTYLLTVGNIRQYSDRIISSLLTLNPSIIPTIIYDEIRPSVYSLDQAIKMGDLPMLQYLLKYAVNISSVRLYQYATINNHIHIIYWLKEHNYKFNQYMASNAINHNHIHILQWYVDNGGVCDGSFTYVAIQSKRIGILRWLINHGVPWPDDAMSTAVRIGNVEIILYMLEFFPKLSTDLHKCILFGEYTWFQWCVVDQQWPVCGLVINLIIEHGRTDMLQLLCDCGYQLPDDGCSTAALNSQLEMLKWLVEHGVRCDASTFSAAVLNNEWGCENIIQYLIDNQCEIDYIELHNLYHDNDIDCDIIGILQKYDIL